MSIYLFISVVTLALSLASRFPNTMHCSFVTCNAIVSQDLLEAGNIDDHMGPTSNSK